MSLNSLSDSGKIALIKEKAAELKVEPIKIFSNTKDQKILEARQEIMNQYNINNLTARRFINKFKEYFV